MKHQKINIAILLLAVAGLIICLFSDSNESSLINVIFCSTSVFFIVVSLLSLIGKLRLFGIFRKLFFVVKILAFLVFLGAGFLMIRESFMQTQRATETKNALLDSGIYK